ncbi:MAG: tetratricopeptide repeat protein [Armatimonadota bacterium]
MTLTTGQFFTLTPGPAHARLHEAEGYFLAGNLNEALAAAQQAWREHPQEPDVFRVLAYLHMARGEFPPAVQAARQSVVLQNDNPLSFAILAQVYLTFGVQKMARDVLTQAQERFPGDLTFTALLADLCMRSRQYRQGVELAQRVLAGNPDDGYMKALLGQHFRTQRKYESAATYLRDAVTLYPQRADYLRDLGISLLHGKQPDEAARCLARSMLLNPRDALTKHYLLYAIRTEQAGSWYWHASWFFYEHGVLGWIIFLIGLLALPVGGIWLLVIALNANTQWQEMSVPLSLFLVGILSVVLTSSGISMPMRKGDHFALYLQQLVERLKLAEQPGE